MAGTLALFWGLAAVEKDVRLDASDALVSALVDQSSKMETGDAFIPEESSTSVETSEEEAAASEERIDALSADTSYSLRRLIRGLASPRENARTGFAVALTELLGHLSSVSSHDILVLLLKHTVARGNLSGQEVRDLQFARIFGTYALIRSGVVYSRGSLAVFQRIFDVILAVAANKSWISESCGWVLVNLVDGLRAEPAWADDALAWTADQVCANADLSPEKLALIIVLMRYPQLRITERFAPLKSPSLLASANLGLLAATLREGAPLHLAPTPQPKSGSWSAKLPFVWDMIFDVYFGDNAQLREGAAPFPDAFRILVDENLFSNNASSERKSWGFQVLHLALQRAPADLLPFLFTPNLMRTWINHLSDKDRLLHAMAIKTVSVVSDAVKRNQTAGVALVTQLLGEHGRQNFDRITHTKTIESILASLDESGVQQYLAYLRSIAYAPAASDDAKYITSQRQWVCDQMLALIRSNLMPKAHVWVQDVIVFLLGFGYFNIAAALPAPWQHVIQKPAVPFSEDTQAMCRARFLSCLSELKGDVEGRPWVLHAYDTFVQMDKSKAFKSLAEPVNRQRMDAGAGIMRTLKKAAKAQGDDRKRILAFEKLLAAVIFVAHEDEEDAPDMIEPLGDAAKLLFIEKPRSGIQPIEVLIDSLIDLFEVSSAFLRSVVCSTFTEFSDEVNEPALLRLVEQLGIGTEEDEEDAEEEENEENDGDDAEGEVEKDDDEAEDEDEDEDDEDNIENGNSVDPVLRSKVEEAMRTMGAADDSDEEGDLDDDQMLSLDDKLADIFRQHSSTRRKERETAKRDTALFQNKVLDLLEIYAKEQSGNPLVLIIIEPLYALAKGPGDTSPQVANRAGQILRTRVCKGKEQPRDGFDVKRTLESLAMLQKSMRTGNQATLADLTNALSQYYTKVLLRSAAASNSDIAAIYAETLNDFLKRKASPVRPAFLLDTIRRFPELGWDMRNELLNGSRVSSAARVFRQMQALQMLQAVIQQQQQESTRQAQPDEVLAFVGEVRAMIVETVSSATSSDESQLNAQRLKDVLRFILQVARISVRVAQDASDSNALFVALPPSEFAALSEQLSASDRFKNSTSLLGMLKEAQTITTRSASEPSRKRAAPESARKSKVAKSG